MVVSEALWRHFKLYLITLMAQICCFQLLHTLTQIKSGTSFIAWIEL